MTEPINPTSATTMNASLALSRKIHKQLVSKKNRWKPSELELAVLKLHFQNNKYPIKEDKEALIKTLEEQFGSKIDINQLSRWFQHEREKATKNSLKGAIKNTYKKFGKEELDFLQELFNKNNYPKMEEMVAIAKKLGVGLSKIENWYKHNRRSLAKRGFFTLKTKKYFKRDELSYLVEMFETCPRPTKEQINDMAERLECSESQIKNWYSNKRKKLKFMAKKQTAESTEASFHKTSFSGFSKSVSDLTPNSFPDTNLSFQSNSYQQFLEQKPATVPNFLLNRPIPTLSNPNPYNNYQSSNLPVLILPTSMNTNSSMVFNTNIINNNTDTISNSSTAPSTNVQGEKESRPSFMEFQAKAAAAAQESAKPIISSPAPSKLFNNFFQSGSNTSFQNAQPIQIPVPIQNSQMDSSANRWFSQTQLSQIQSGMNLFANKGVQMPNQAPMFNQVAQNGAPMMTVINPYSLPLNNVNQMGQFNQMAGGMPSESPMQIQYLTSLYLPYSNNNIFNNCYPMVYSNGSEMCMPGQMQPQMNLNNLMPATGTGFNSH